jgi:chaperonin GroEL (HSP60 family)
LQAIHDAQSVVVRTLEHPRYLAGGGAAEIELSLQLERYANTFGDTLQLVITAYAHALLCIPFQLALNSGYDATSLISGKNTS